MKSKSAPFQNSRANGKDERLENLRVTWRLLRDPNVAPFAKKLLPILALVYLISPIDLIPDVLLGLGQVDDVGVIGLVIYFLVALVRRAGLESLQETKATGFTRHSAEDDNVIDARYRIVSDSRQRRDSTLFR
jgi:uncharacterized membrane protein YkvA (DUF1232 family)